MEKELIDIATCGNCKHRNMKEGVCNIKPRFNERGKIIEERAKVKRDEPGCVDFDKKETSDLKEIYRNLIDIFKSWADMREEYYNIVSLWVIGTYFHKEFPTYPYLFFNAMRGSGKTRILKLITYLSKDGALLNSLTETELFRSKGTLGIDEFEGINRKGLENLRELLNSGYKRGSKVRRMKKVSSKQGENYEVEEFDVYRPITIANISGMEDVLSDRCLSLILEKSNKVEIVDLIEVFEDDELIKKTKELLEKVPLEMNECCLCSFMSLSEMYLKWNSYIRANNTNNTNNNTNTNNTNYTHLFKSIKFAGINGRELELSFPLFILSNEVGEIETTLTSISSIMQEKREEGLIENRDIALYDFLSQEQEVDYFVRLTELVRKFKSFLQINDDDINSKWMGRALKRLNLIIEKRRISQGVEIKLNYKKAREKIRMFK